VDHGVLVTVCLIQDTATRLVEEAGRRWVVVEPGTAPLIQMRPMTLDEIVEDICECWAAEQRRQRES